jgi:hypothetical protein
LAFLGAFRKTINLIEHARAVVAIMGLAYAGSRFHKMFANRKTKPSGELEFDASTGTLRANAAGASTATAHMATNPLPPPRPNLPYSLWDQDAETRQVVHEILRRQHNYLAPMFSRSASSDVLGSPRVLLDGPK